MYTDSALAQIAGHFSLRGDITAIKPLGEGFINDTFVISTPTGFTDYILQRKNRNVFPDIPAMMENISKVTDHMRHRVQLAGGNPDREVMRVVPTRDGKLYFLDEAGEYWTVSEYIPDTICYSKADTPELARQGGIGIGHFQALLSDFNEQLTDTIKGFHNIRHRLCQWDGTLRRDPVGRVKDLKEEIAWIESRRTRMLSFWEKVENGEIPTRVTHNDTKISNILFDKSGDALCAIDLDTVMSAPALNDFGDAIRSYCNTAEEDEPDLSRVAISMEMFEAYSDGYLSEQISSLTSAEIDHLAFSALYITYEQVLRFLMDYIDGDRYYRIKYPEHNLVRARAQYKLLQSMEEHYSDMCRIIEDTAARYTSPK